MQQEEMITAAEEGVSTPRPRSTRFRFWRRKTMKNKRKTNKINDNKLIQKNKDLETPPLCIKIEPSPLPRIQRLIAKESIYGDPHRPLKKTFPSKYQHQSPSPRSSNGNHQWEAPMTCSATPVEKWYKKISKGFSNIDIPTRGRRRGTIGENANEDFWDMDDVISTIGGKGCCKKVCGEFYDEDDDYDMADYDMTCDADDMRMLNETFMTVLTCAMDDDDYYYEECFSEDDS
jgi:hypothetical protein